MGQRLALMLGQFSTPIDRKGGPGDLPDIDFSVFEGSTDVYHQVHRYRSCAEHVEAVSEGRAIVENFLRRGVFGGFGGGLKQFVVGGDDILDFGAGPRFLEGDGVDQHTLVGDQLTGPLQLRKRPIGADRLPQYFLALQLNRWR